MPRCAGNTDDGSPCQRIVKASQHYCYSHDPERAEERKHNAARGGKAKANRELAEIKTLLATLTARVLKEEGVEPLEPGPAAVVNQLINTRLRALEQERKNKETEDLEGRIEALERTQEGGKRWGA
jgi:hypothetical protein